MKIKFSLFGIFLVLAAMGSSQAGNLVAPSVTETRNPNLTTIATKCTRLIRRSGRETLINTCNSCRLVGVTRKRAGIPTPVRREFSLAGRSQFPVPFRGPGVSRITSDIMCKGQPNPNAAPVNTEKKCVSLEQRPQGKVVMVNSCGTCRGVAIQRMTRAGQSLGLQAYKIFPQAVVMVTPKGAARVAIAGEVACPS
jgi:hypothetical protein